MVDPFMNLRLQAIKKLLPQEDYLTVCDIGCGKGIFTKACVEIFFNSQIVGMDIDIKKIKDAQSGIPSASLFIANGTNIPIKSASCDLVLCLEVIEHQKNAEYLLKEIYRILKPGGVLLVSTPNMHSLTALTGKITYFLVRTKFLAFDKTHINLYHPKKLLCELSTFQFNNFDLHGIWIFPIGASHPSVLRKLIKSTIILNFMSKSYRNSILVEMAFITVVICKKGSE